MGCAVSLAGSGAISFLTKEFACNTSSAPRSAPSRWSVRRLLPGYLALARLARAAEQDEAPFEGNPACWSEGFSYRDCCDESFGPGGNINCWDGMHTHASCCLPGGTLFTPPADYEELLARGHTGDTSVLPAIMQMLSSGGDEDCDARGSAGPPRGRCDGPAPTAKQWKAFFEASAVSKFLRIQPWPAEGEPAKLWAACCSDERRSIEEQVLALAETCAAGAAALVFSMLPELEKQHGHEATRKHYLLAQRLAHELEGEEDCRWHQQTNRATWNHFDWFLAPDGRAGEWSMPCGKSDVRIFVDERASAQVLRAHPLSCAQRGLCFTEVWVHEFLQQAACRVANPEEADFSYVPIYGSCYDLHAPSDDAQAEALEALMQNLVAEPGPPLLLVLTCEKWKLRGWRRWLQGGGKVAAQGMSKRGYLVAAVEAKPLLGPSDEEGISTSVASAWHCEDCFRPGRDIVLPSAVLPGEGSRLHYFNRDPAERTLLLVWRGEHAESATRSDVREGYLEVNETVRPAIIKHLGKKPDADVGGPSMRYGFLMGNTHFCLVPRGRGWWTVRLFEAFYAGCVPVLLSDGVELPFEEFLRWDTFSVKWPMREVNDKLYDHLRALRDDWPRMEALHRGVRSVACWFDFHSPKNADCSPYQGFLKVLTARKHGWNANEADRLTQASPPLTRFWF